MKKNLKTLYLLVLVFLSLQTLILSTISGNTSFINSFWNTLGFGDNNVLTDWSEAGKEDFSLLGFTGALYIKNDNLQFYLGVLILGEIGENLTWRLNFDVDADGGWAEDCKELNISVVGGVFNFKFYDRYYIRNNPQPFNDSSSNDYSASYRIFSYAGNEYIIFELKIPFQTADFYRDLQIQDPETTIIGFSMDIFKIDVAQNETWKGGQYPDYANSADYTQILFAGPQDRKTPVFEEEPLPTTSEIPEDTSTEPEGPPDYERESAASSFEAWVGLIAIFAVVFTLRKIKWRNQ
ncbi:MAG: hypothetical protein ACFE95_01970 [Candidatus Hodarchaeota archaeon]